MRKWFRRCAGVLLGFFGISVLFGLAAAQAGDNKVKLGKASDVPVLVMKSGVGSKVSCLDKNDIQANIVEIDNTSVSAVDDDDKPTTFHGSQVARIICSDKAGNATVVRYIACTNSDTPLIGGTVASKAVFICCDLK
jgi:hypothetical protein